MPKAATIPTTSRRSALRGISLTAIAAGLAVPALASAAPDDADAELIRLCAKFVELETEHYLLCRHDPRAPDFGPNHELYERLSDGQQHAIDMLEQCEPPTSPAGYAAVARAALTWAYLDDEGNFEAGGDFHEEMLIRLAIGAAGRDFVWPPRPGSCPTAHWAPPTSPEEIARYRSLLASEGRTMA